MSGGAFEYQQYHIEEIADYIEQEIIEAGRVRASYGLHLCEARGLDALRR